MVIFVFYFNVKDKITVVSCNMHIFYPCNSLHLIGATLFKCLLNAEPQVQVWLSCLMILIAPARKQWCSAFVVLEMSESINSLALMTDRKMWKCRPAVCRKPIGWHMRDTATKEDRYLTPTSLPLYCGSKSTAFPFSCHIPTATIKPRGERKGNNC